MMTRCSKQLLLSVIAIVGTVAVAAPCRAEEEGSRFDTLRRTKGATLVYAAPRRGAYRLARIFPGAVLALGVTDHRRGCPKGWMEREGGGYVCADDLGATDATAPAPAARDLPGVLDGSLGWVVERGGAKMYRREKDIDRHTVFQRLIKESFLMVKETMTRYGTVYHRTREGMWVTGSHTSELSPAPRTLRVDVTKETTPVAGLVIEEGVRVFASPDPDSASDRELKRWDRIAPPEGAEHLISEDGWIRLRDGGYVRDEQVARIRPVKTPAGLEFGERWIAVDLGEQLLLAFEGERLVAVAPCSTGSRGNTREGSYRIQWKRRLQTMRLRGGHLRVEDVQWVMYYDRRRSIAIHAAYWHDSFGKSVSHGCVNLPTDDARWLYEWALPLSLPEDSESFQSPANKGTRVLVFQ